jgi:hypothetical protein
VGVHGRDRCRNFYFIGGDEMSFLEYVGLFAVVIVMATLVAIALVHLDPFEFDDAAAQRDMEDMLRADKECARAERHRVNPPAF